MPLSAAPVIFNQTTSDLLGGSSYTDGTRWTPAGVPTSGTAVDPHYYNVTNSVLRTPGAGTPEFGGAGASNLRLYINTGGRLIFQAGVSGTVISDLRMNGGEVFVGAGGAVALDGLIFLESNSEFDAHRGTAAQKQLTVNGVISDGDSSGANLQIQSSGDDGGVVRFNNSGNDYNGDTIVGTAGGNDTVLRMGTTDAMPDAVAAGDVIVNGPGFFQTNGFNTTVQGMSGAGTAENASATAATLTIQGDQGGTNNTFGGVISDGAGGGALSVTKTGASTTQTFSGANTYTGTTSVEGGRLVVASDAGLGATSGGTTIASGGGTVELAGSSTNEPFTLEARADDSTAHLDATGNSSSTIGASGSITLADGADPANFNITSNTTGTAVFNIGADIDGTGTSAAVQDLNFGGGADGEGVVSGAVNMDAGATTTLNVGGDASWEFSGALSDVDNLNVSGGLTTLSGSSKTIGTVDVSGGTLDLATGLTTANTVTVGAGAELTQTGSNISASQSGGYDVDGTVDLNGAGATMTTLDGDATGVVDNTDAAPATLTLNSASNGTFDGTVQDSSGAVSIEKDGTGSQSIGDIDIAGTIDVSDGTLSAGTVTNAGNVGITGGSTFSVTGTTNAGDLDVTNGTATLNDDATLGAVTVASGSQANLLGSDNSTGAISSSGTLIAPNTTGVDGNLNISGGTASMGSSSGAVEVSNGDVSISGGAIAAIGNLDTTAGTGGAVSVSGAATSATLNGVNTGDDDITVTDGTVGLEDVTATTGDVDVQGGSVDIGGTGGFDGMTVSGGELNVLSSGALGGSGAGDDGEQTDVQGTGVVNIDGSGLSVDEVFNLFARTDTGVQLNNVADSNTITGQINLVEGPGDNFNIESESGTLSLTGDIVSSLSSGGRALNLGGDGDGNVSALDFDDVSGNSVVKTGDGTWTISDAAIDGGTIRSEQGVLALSGSANLSGDMVYEVLADAELDVTGIAPLTLDAADQLKGDGLVDGDIVAATGADITAGDFDSIGEFEVSGLLDLDGLLTVNVSGNSIDKLVIGSNFDITAGSVEFVLDGAISGNALVFATYGSLTGTDFANITGLPADYRIEFGWEGRDEIALVSNNPVPVPATLTLMAAGLFGMSRARRNRRQADQLLARPSR